MIEKLCSIEEAEHFGSRQCCASFVLVYQVRISEAIDQPKSSKLIQKIHRWLLQCLLTASLIASCAKIPYSLLTLSFFSVLASPGNMYCPLTLDGFSFTEICMHSTSIVLFDPEESWKQSMDSQKNYQIDRRLWTRESPDRLGLSFRRFCCR